VHEETSAAPRQRPPVKNCEALYNSQAAGEFTAERPEPNQLSKLAIQGLTGRAGGRAKGTPDDARRAVPAAIPPPITPRAAAPTA
jgi:hypothetical protein